ncbi:mechanosensitive ion channel family protein [Steroidobacter sp. S1-65]|uniref:Mechanosensitive ion channel family protein n=1 Tax=Steroidobacter gossypii TaxID=2805490 RepID=A0ABS1WWR9_9GAMM|nr:mechanosensitive ion channel family protein [Steroidobacter gossypii]MBM0105427.1 mechanosensitive ion channel family protein [Steroidobacter gossypii]
MTDYESLSRLPIFDNTLLDWSIALGVAAVALFVLLFVRRTVRTYHSKMQATTEKELLEIPIQVLSRTTLLLLVVVALFIGSQWLVKGPAVQRVLQSAVTIALFWQAGIWMVAAVAIWLDRKRQRSLATDRAAVGSLGIIGFVLNVVIWAMVLLLTLDNLGIDITALIAGLGIGGIAVALAVQNVLGDLFASLSITLDRPFVVGDFLIVGDFMGSVEYIGIKSTRLRSLSGEQIVIANSDLLSSRVRNYGRMNERRVVFGTSITYETDPAHIERIPSLIREIVESQPDTRFDRSHFAKHAAASLDFETVYYVLSADFNKYMDIQQQINLRLHRELLAMGVEFAYPTQKLYLVDQTPAPAGAVKQRRDSPLDATSSKADE